jgi:hypothetical protein
MNFAAQGCYPESSYTSSLLLRLSCWAVSAASRHAGCPVTQGRTYSFQWIYTAKTRKVNLCIQKVPTLPLWSLPTSFCAVIALTACIAFASAQVSLCLCCSRTIHSICLSTTVTSSCASARGCLESHDDMLNHVTRYRHAHMEVPMLCLFGHLLISVCRS